MGFLKSDINEEDSDPDKDLEEQYLKLFPKIGRDFVTREDLEAVIQQIMFTIDPLGLSPVQVDDSAARDRAAKYSNLLDKDKGESERDLVELKEEEE